MRKWSLTLHALTEDFTPTGKASHGKMEQEWEYSESSLTIEGTTPSDKKFSAPLEPMDAPINDNN